MRWLDRRGVAAWLEMKAAMMLLLLLWSCAQEGREEEQPTGGGGARRRRSALGQGNAVSRTTAEGGSGFDCNRPWGEVAWAGWLIKEEGGRVLGDWED